MALSVINCAPPVRRIRQGGEVVASRHGGGLREIARFQNAAYEQMRANLINDYSPAALIEELGASIEYRPGNPGRAEVEGESVIVELWVSAVDGGDSAPSLATVSVSCGDQTLYWSYSDDLLEPTLVALGALEIPADIEGDEAIPFSVTIESIGANDLVSVNVFGLAVYYERARSELEASSGGYGNGFTPQDLAVWDGEEFVSSASIAELHANAAVLAERSTEVVGGYCRALRDGVAFAGTAPDGATHIRVRVQFDGAFAGLTVATVVTDSHAAGGAVSPGWYQWDVPVTPGALERVIVSVTDPHIRAVTASWVRSVDACTVHPSRPLIIDTTAAARSPIHNGQPGRASVVQPLEDSCVALALDAGVGFGGSISPLTMGGLMPSIALWRFRVALTPFSRRVRVLVCLVASSIAADAEILAATAMDSASVAIGPEAALGGLVLRPAVYDLIVEIGDGDVDDLGVADLSVMVTLNSAHALAVYGITIERVEEGGL